MDKNAKARVKIFIGFLYLVTYNYILSSLILTPNSLNIQIVLDLPSSYYFKY